MLLSHHLMHLASIHLLPFPDGSEEQTGVGSLLPWTIGIPIILHQMTLIILKKILPMPYILLPPLPLLPFCISLKISGSILTESENLNIVSFKFVECLNDIPLPSF